MATALVTGGSSGIGAAFARLLAAEGHDVVLVARDGERLADAASALHASFGIHVETIVADLTDRADVAAVVARIEDPARPIDVLINNAGSSLRAALADPDLSAHDAAFELMARAVFVLGGAAARAMRERGGTIVTVSSLQSLLTTGAYSTIKAFATSYTQALSVELRGTGVRVSVVLPGWVRTEWHERSGGSRSSIPSWLWIEPEVVARVALRDARRGRVVSIPTIRYRVLGWFARHLPWPAVRAISARLSSRRETGAVPGSEAPSMGANARTSG